MSDKSQANKLGAILLSKGLALNAAMIKPGWFVIFWPFDTITSDTKLYYIRELTLAVLLPLELTGWYSSASLAFRLE